MGRKRQNQANGFKSGHIKYHEVCQKPSPASFSGPENTSPAPGMYKRMEMEDFHDNVHDRDGMMFKTDPDNQPLIDIRILRPRPAFSVYADPRVQACLEKSSRPDMETMRLFHPKKLENLFNQAYQQHRETSPGCLGDLLMDECAEIKKGLCYKERLKCSVCGFTSKRVSLYQDVPSSTRGAKAAAPNVGMQIGLSHTPAGNADLAHILNAAGVPAPARSGMQQSSNRVMDILVDINTSDMEAIRGDIRQNNVNKGLPLNTPIRVEGDAQYNNPLRGGGRTPFQPGTQAWYTLSENETKSKKIIGVQVTNKLCRKCGGKQTQNSNVDCINCSANVPMDHTIGDERHMVVGCLSTVMPDTDIIYVTTDQDSQSFSGFQSTAKDMGKTPPEKLNDTHHLSKSLRRAINKETFSANMFPKTNIKNMTKDKWLNRFAIDLSQRCQAEYAASLSKYGSETNVNIAHLSYVTDAIILCFQGYHTLCDKHSLVCSGRGSKLLRCEQNKTVLLTMTVDDQKKIRSLIGTRLGRSAIIKTRLGTNTQKSEAINSAYMRSVPKSKTFTRNVYGRINSRIHLLNNGRCLSTIRKANILGIKMYGGSRVVRQLCYQQKKVSYDKKRQENIKYQSQRSRSISLKYALHRQKMFNNVKTYSKGMLDPERLRKPDHTYGKCRT